MKRYIYPKLLVLTLILGLISLQSTQASEATTKAKPPVNISIADLAEFLSPAVVNISTTKKVRPSKRRNNRQFGSMFQDMPPAIQKDFEFFFGMPQERMQRPEEEPKEEEQNLRTKPNSLGSGFVINQNGTIITNYHVIEGADEITITFNDDKKLEAEIVGKDEKTDLAVLKVKSSEPLSYVRFGDSDKVRVGDWIVAIGNPYGLGGTVTAGIISARARDINSGPYDDFLQTDAAINKGNSGGPMFNLQGEVIGINTAIFSPSGGNVGIGFAIPTNLIEPLVEQIIEKGEITRGWLGVKIQEVTEELAEGLGIETAKGALVIEITEGGPAQAAGLEEGDVVVKFNNRDIKSMRKLPRIVAETPTNVDVPVIVIRDGKEIEFTVKVGVLDSQEKEKIEPSLQPEQDNTKDENRILGMQLKPADNKLQERLGLEGYGLVVSSIDNKSEAYSRGIRKGNVIFKANHTRLESQQSLTKAISKAKSRNRSSILLLVTDGESVRFVAVPIKG